MAEDYKVKKGDNLTKIAREKGVSLQELIDANPQVKDPNLIITGEKLNIPGDSEQSGAGSLSSEESYEDSRFRTMQDDSNPFNREEGQGSEEREPPPPEPEE